VLDHFQVCIIINTRHVREICVTKNNGFWIGWLDLLAVSLQLQSIITAQNQWLSKTCSIPYWTTSVFSSTVTDLVPIYESVTSSTATALRMTRTELKNELFFITSVEPNKSHYALQFLYYSLIPLPLKRVLVNLWLAMDFSSVRCENLCLASCWFWLHYSGLQVLSHNILYRVVPLRQQPYKFCGLIYFHQPVTRPGVRDR
jgi:hypothetical protein